MIVVLRHVVAVMLVLMHVVVGRAAGGAVCLGGGVCDDRATWRGEGVAAGSTASHADDEFGWRSSGTGCDHGVPVGAGDAERGNHHAPWPGDETSGDGDECGCLDAWVPHARADDGRGGATGAFDAPAWVFARVAFITPAGRCAKATPLVALWPPGPGPGLRSTVLLI